MDELVMSKDERERVESFKNEDRRKWEREQYYLGVDADHRGETFTPGVYQEVSDADALAAVRGGWKSELEKRFEKKFRRESLYSKK